MGNFTFSSSHDPHFFISISFSVFFSLESVLLLGFLGLEIFFSGSVVRKRWSWYSTIATLQVGTLVPSTDRVMGLC